MRLKRIKINGLFGIFNHDIPLFMDERITIIHSPNGFGKTTILKILDDLFAKRLHSLGRVPFSKILLFFEGSRRLEIYQEEQEQNKGKDPSPIFPSLHFRLYKGKKIEHDTTIKPSSREKLGHYSFPMHIIEQTIDSLERVGPYEWLDHSTGDMLDIDDVIERYSDYLPERIVKEDMVIPEWLLKFLKEVNVHFIQTQRLISLYDKSSRLPRRNRSIQERSVVEQHSKDLAEKIQDLLRQSGSLSASLDRTFPQRLLEQPKVKDVAEDIIRKEYIEQNKYRTRLMNAGLIEGEKPVPLPERVEGLEEIEIRVLWHYLNDVKKKFEIFDGLLQKVELFKEIINSRFLFKEFGVDKIRGFGFRATSGRELSAKSLSSGEQHELVLAYQLLFMVPEKSLLLIDEPELSLHITWQHKFLDDLARISKLADLDFIIATHSPSIIHKRTDLEIPLKGPK